MKILSLDLGKNKTVGCDYERESGKHRFPTAFSTRAGLAQLVKEVNSVEESQIGGLTP